MLTYTENKPLILLCGMPRSGTTWLGKLFDSDPHTLYRHEPDSIERLAWLPLYIEPEFDGQSDQIQEYIQYLPNICSPKVSASMPVFSKSYMGPVKQTLIHQTFRLVKVLSLFGINHVPRYCIPKDHSSYQLVWKSIESAGRLGYFADVLQNKRLIFLLRHPCAITNSIIRGGRKQFKDYDVAEDWDIFQALLESKAGKRWGFSLDDIQDMRPIERMGWKFLVTMEKAVKDLEGREDCKVVVYEDLCENPGKIMKELFEFCKIPFGQQTSEFLNSSTSKTDPQYYSVTKLPLESAYKWKSELPQHDQQLLLKLLDRSLLAQFWTSPT